MQLIGIGSFVFGLVQGLSRPLIHTQIELHTHTHAHTYTHTLSCDRKGLEGLVKGGGRGSVCLVNDSRWAKADREAY